MNRRSGWAALGVLGVALAGCSEMGVLDPAEPLAPEFAVGRNDPGAVYVLSNAATGNAVLRFDRSAQGALGTMTSFPTGGTGTGAGLGSQGAVVLSENERWLFAVDAGSNELAVFRIEGNGLELTDHVPSGGEMPISVTFRAGVAYVLNAGGAGNITGFTLSAQGQLTPLAGSTQPLSGAATGGAQVEFTPDARQLVVTEKATNLILTYDVDASGVASAPTSHASSGMTPFGFAFMGRDRLIVSEAFGGAPDASALSSYVLGGGFTPVSASVATTETAACWVAVSKNGRFAYTTNTGSGSVTGYAIAQDGSLTILDADGVTGSTGAGSSPIDLDFSDNGRFLYVLNAGTQTISAFALESDGSLFPIGGASGLPMGAAGLTAR
jgi:DNA-binding beta-propeller fold protein YncE